MTQAQMDGALPAVSAQVRLDAINALLQQQRLQPWKDQQGRYLFRDVGVEHSIKCARRLLLCLALKRLIRCQPRVYKRWDASSCS